MKGGLKRSFDLPPPYRSHLVNGFREYRRDTKWQMHKKTTQILIDGTFLLLAGDQRLVTFHVIVESSP